MLNKIDLSVVVVCFNSVKTIQRCLDSIISQSHKPKQLIIIDGASTDGTLEILENYKAYITDFISETDNGIYDAMNKGLSFCKQEFFLFLNSDDYLADENVLKKYSEPFKNEQIGFVFGNIDLVNNWTIKRHWEAEFCSNALHFASRIPHPGLAVKTELLQDLKGFDCNYSIASDYEFILRLVNLHTNFFHVDCTVVKMELGGASTKGYKNLLKQHLELMSAILANGYSLFDYIRFIIDRINFKKAQKTFSNGSSNIR